VAHDDRALGAPSSWTSWWTCSVMSSSGAGSPPLSPCAGRSIAMLVMEPSSLSMIGRQLRRSVLLLQPQSHS